MPSMMTRIRINDWETWKAMFDQDSPNAREHADAYRVFRGVEDPNEVFIQVDFPSSEAAQEARSRLVASGVLDKLIEHTGPSLVEEADARQLS
jgi:hypothetical protein